MSKIECKISDENIVIQLPLNALQDLLDGSEYADNQKAYGYGTAKIVSIKDFAECVHLALTTKFEGSDRTIVDNLLDEAFYMAMHNWEDCGAIFEGGKKKKGA